MSLKFKINIKPKRKSRDPNVGLEYIGTGGPQNYKIVKKVKDVYHVKYFSEDWSKQEGKFFCTLEDFKQSLEHNRITFTNGTFQY